MLENDGMRRSGPKAQTGRLSERGEVFDGASAMGHLDGVMEPEKKSVDFPEPASGAAEGHSLEAFRDRLRDLCGDHIEGDGDNRTCRSKDEAEQAVPRTREYGFLSDAAETWGGG